MRTLVILLTAVSGVSCSNTIIKDNGQIPSHGKSFTTASGSTAISFDKVATCKLLKQLATDRAKAVLNADYDKVIELTHPAQVKIQGGRDETISELKRVSSKMTFNDSTVEFDRVDDPSEIVESQSVLYCFVPMMSKITSRQPKQVLSKTTLYLATSSDGGKSWKFVDDSSLEMRELVNVVLPNWPATLKLPVREEPVVIR